MTSARTCKNCGSTLALDARFCGHCGTGQMTAPDGLQPREDNLWTGLFDRLSRAVEPRYRVIRLLGYGGMAGVYLAEEPRLGRRVAIKVMAPALMADPAFVTRFSQEARTIAQLNHPNIVTVFDVDDRDSLHYFVMAYVPGQTLGSLVARDPGALPLAAIEHVFAQTASALAYAHREGVVHRDIKPGNIMIDGRGNALVTDFGIAKVADEPSVTRTGLLVGTPAYMSPEQCLSTPVTGASDQYSLAIVMYELLTGAPPFTGQTIGILHSHVHESPRPVSELRPDCPTGLATALERMLAKKPEQRFPTMSAAIIAAGAGSWPDDHPGREELSAAAAVADAVEVRGDATLRAGEAVRLEATVIDASGRPLTNRPVQWTSEAGAIATVNEEGVVYALAPGTVRVAAWCDGVAGVTTLVITKSELPVEVLTPRAQLEPGEHVELTARLRGPASTRPVHWSTSDPRIAQVTGEGRVVALSPGLVTITASTGEHFASTTLTVARGSSLVAPALGVSPTTPAPPDTGPTPASGPRTPPSTERPQAEPAAVPPVLGRLPAVTRAGRGRWIAASAAVVVIGLVAAAIIVRGAGEPTVPEPQATSTASSGGAPVAADPPPQPTPPETVASIADSSTTIQTTAAAPETTQTRAPAARTPPSTRTATPDPPRPGTLHIAGALPADAIVTVTGPGGARVIAGPTVELAQGTYTIEILARGFRTLRHEVTLRTGQTETWSPTLEAVEPERPPVQRPTTTVPTTAARDPAADAAVVRTSITEFVAALATRNLDAIAQRFPGASGAWRQQWSAFYQDTRNVRNLATRLVQVDRVDVDGDVARSTFIVDMAYMDFRNQRQQPRFTFQATFRRSETGWTLIELTQSQ